MKKILYFILTAASKKIILTSLILMGLGLSSQVSAQTVGDYQSAGDGNWNNASSWQYFDGANWVAATDYPGHYSNVTYGVVTIQKGNTITISGLTLTAGSIELFAIQEVILDGNLLIDYQAAVTIDTQLFIVTPGWGTITFGNNLNKNSLTLPSDATLIVTNGGIVAGQSNNTYIKVGNTWAKSGNPTFVDLMNLGGANVIGVTTVPAAKCDNTPTKFTFTAAPNPSSNVSSIQWLNADKTIISGATASSYTTDLISVTTTYYVRVTYSIPIRNSPSYVYTIESLPIVARFGTNAWIGNTRGSNNNYNWSTPANWSCNVPVQTTDVLIPKGTNAPHIDIPNAVCHDLTIDAYPGVVIDAGKGLVVGNNLTVNGSLTIQSDAVNNNGSLIVNGNSTGFFTYNRFITPDKWFIVSSPVNTVPDFDDLNKSKINNGKDYDFAWYEEPDNYGWNYYNPIPSVLAPGKGHLARLITGNNTLQFDGELNGDVNATVTCTGTDNGWNAVGNPFTSALDIKSATGFIASNLDALETDYAAIYIWSDPTGYIPISNGSYLAYSGSGSIVDQNIQAGQGFLINVKSESSETTAKTVKFKKGDATVGGMQVANTSTSLKKSETSWSGITLLATNNGHKSSTVLAFNENMTPGLDPSYDAGLLSSSDFNLYTHLVEGGSETGFAIQCLPDNMYESLVVPVGIDLPQASKVTFKVAGVILPEGLYPVIEDRLLQVSVPLKNETDSLTVSFDEPTSGTGRFYLSFGRVLKMTGLTSKAEAGNFAARFADQKITLFGTPEQGSRAWLYDINGRKMSGEYRLTSANQNEIPASGLASGIYLLKIEGKTTRQTIKVSVVK